jgi:alanyl-tRNA synthetase
MKLYSGRIDGLGHLELKKLIDKVRSRSHDPFGILLVSRDKERANFVAAVDKALLEKGFQPANEICRTLGTRTKGGGGGKPGMAQGQGRAGDNLDDLVSEALEEARSGLRA